MAEGGRVRRQPRAYRESTVHQWGLGEVVVAVAADVVDGADIVVVAAAAADVAETYGCLPFISLRSLTQI